MRGVVENPFGFVGGELQAPDPENHKDQAVAKDERTYLVDATDEGLSFNSQPSRHVFYFSCNALVCICVCLSSVRSNFFDQSCDFLRPGDPAMNDTVPGSIRPS